MRTVELSQKFQTVSLEDLASVQGGRHHSSAYNAGNETAHVAKGIGTVVNWVWTGLKFASHFAE